MIQEKSLTKLEANARALKAEMSWLKTVLDTRFNLYFGKETEYPSIYDIPAPNLEDYPCVYSDFVRHYNMQIPERIVVLLALAPEVAPQLLDVFFVKNEMNGRIFTEFGGITGNVHRGFLPTAETAIFVLAGNNLTRRFQANQIFDDDYYLLKQRIISLDRDRINEPALSGTLRLSREYLTYMTTGAAYKPVFSNDFPAQRISTNLDWDDLVLDPLILHEVNQIQNWIKYQNTLLNDWGLRKVIKPGYRSLFYGPPGTGKTLTASLLGKAANMDVYRVDISKMVSKYIGETEKNLANIFDQAENKNWILFFDEADALFGKRSTTSDAKDRYANQEVSYLLQRIEDFPGLISLATNFKSNIDTAFTRRFQSIIYFPMPGQEQRKRLWENNFKSVPVADEVNFRQLAREYDLSGGTIINVLRYCSLLAVSRDKPMIRTEDIIEGIKGEMRKEGKTV
ncbi:MAG: ATP-binding protein [Bacteroidia bacterium]|nr:ATP-binding protein [Bacteroidia bacterium]